MALRRVLFGRKRWEPLPGETACAGNDRVSQGWRASPLAGILVPAAGTASYALQDFTGCRCSPLLLGSAGEAAGLRVPRVGLSGGRQPCWVMHGKLFTSLMAECKGTGSDAVEASGAVPMCW